MTPERFVLAAANMKCGALIFIRYMRSIGQNVPRDHFLRAWPSPPWPERWGEDLFDELLRHDLATIDSSGNIIETALAEDWIKGFVIEHTR